MPSTMVEYRSKRWMKLCPMNAIATSITTMITRASATGMPVRLASANEPLIEFVANQPSPAMIVLRAAGRMLPRVPNAVRPSTICATPSRGPHDDSSAWVMQPSALPTTIASSAVGKPSPKNATAMTPTKTVANSMFGAVQVASNCHGDPWRRAMGIASMPPGSTNEGFSDVVAVAVMAGA